MMIIAITTHKSTKGKTNSLQ